MGTQSAEMTSPKRKRASSDEHVDEAKRPRGRPRVQKQDETAADRRRTQIRLAQRAYRSRKEVTISSLKGNAAELERIVRQLNTTFTNFKDQAAISGLAETIPNLAETLRVTAKQFTRLIHQAENLPSEHPEHSDQTSPLKSSSPEDMRSPNTAQEAAAALYPTPSPSVHETDNVVTHAWGYQWYYGQQPTNLNESSGEEDATEMQPTQIMQPYNRTMADQRHFISGVAAAAANGPQDINAAAADLYQPFTSLNSPESPVLPSYELPSPFTYSFQEVSFARRLQRACLEGAYHAISNAQGLAPKRVRKAFTIPLLFHNQQEITTTIGQILRRGTNESLDYDLSPFTHVGGAGLHYVRRDLLGNPVQRVLTDNTNPMGPNRFDYPAETELLPALAKLGVSEDEFAGEWLDPEDVEGYMLQEKNIFIDPQASFAEADVPIARDENRVLELADKPVSGDFLNFVGSTPKSEVLTQSATSIVPTSLAYNGRSPIQGPDGTFGDAFDPLADPSFQLAAVTSTRHITLDVQRFINELLKRVRCLGRTPGFRRAEVDRAFERSLVTF